MKLLLSSLFLLVLGVAAFGQKAKPTPTPDKDDTRPGEMRLTRIASIESTSDYAKDGVFTSENGGFSIAIAEFPNQIIDNSTEKAKARGIDTGRQFLWVYRPEKILYTLYYLPSVSHDGDPQPQTFYDVQIGTRKGVINGGGTVRSETPIKLGDIPGSELRYDIPQGVHYISRVFLVNGVGYQVVGGYMDPKDEQAVIKVLDTFKLLPTKR